jgi:Fe-S cluster assembly protein SufD
MKDSAMIETMEKVSKHPTNIRPIERTSGPSAQWFDDLRRLALEQFEAVGFPSNKTELWRHTNVAPIARTKFAPAQPANPPADAIAPFTLGRAAAIELVFVNGRYHAGLSRAGAIDAVSIQPLAEVLHQAPRILEGKLGALAAIDANPFVALNTAFITDGAFIHLREGAAFEKPIHLLFVSVPNGAGEPSITHPRVFIQADKDVRATIVETYAGTESEPAPVYFTNSVTEIDAGEGAIIDHCRLQQESLEAFHVSTTQVSLDAKADFISHSATLGGKLTRNDLNVSLNGEEAHATLNGLVILAGGQHCDNHTLLRHEKPNCPSHELYKHILEDKASAVFRGKIFVQQDAQKTDSKQTSKSLLLSDDANMNSQPALEIYADDVKCTHGSTTGPVDEDMIFYLRTRGVSLEAARHLLTYAFAADVTRRIRVEPVRRRLEDFMAARHDLPQDLRIAELGAHDEAAG